MALSEQAQASTGSITKFWLMLTLSNLL